MKSNLHLTPIRSNYKSILPKHEIRKSLPEKMKAWVTYKGGNTILEELPIPRMLPEDVLVARGTGEGLKKLGEAAQGEANDLE